MTKEKTIYDLNLFEILEIKICVGGSFQYYLRTIRVPGGWIFEKKDSICFVPYSEEFKNKKYDYKGE